MKSVTKKITTNTRVIKSLLTKYRDTFHAFKELINNSIQAKAQRIEINIEYTNTAFTKVPFQKIELIDNGIGVPFSEFDNRILEIGTTVKFQGQGIGRFAALQLGELMHIESVSYDEKEKQFTKTKFSLDSTDFNDAQLEETEFKVDYEVLGPEQRPSSYKVTIEDFYHNRQEKVSKRNSIVAGFLEKNIGQTLFENYPFEIFNRKVEFILNGQSLKREDFVIGTPTTKTVSYIDKKGNEHELKFYFYNIKSSLNKVKVFFQIDNSGIKSVAHEYTYSSDWYTPDLGTWFIYIESPFLNSDLFRNLDLETLGEDEIKRFKESIKETVNDFYKARNKRFEKFVKSLESDKYYVYRDEKPASKSQEVLFKKVAYLLEDEHKLIQRDDKIRDFLYPLLDKALGNGNIEYIFRKILKLSDDNLEKFHGLLEKTDLEDVVHFASMVADKLEFLEFLHETIYGDISKHIKERSQLHKIVENELWLFGENYNGSPKLWSDRKIGNILNELREKYFNYTPTKDDENLIEIEDNGLNDITDLFFFNEKITDSGEREIMVVELKAPKCAISEKELAQINKYAFTLEQNSGLASDNVKYKLLLISSRLTGYAKSQAKSKRAAFPKTPFLFDKKVDKNIEVYVMEWSELIEQNKRKLGYLSSQLQVKDMTVKKKFEKEYSELVNEKIASQLRMVK